MKLQRPMTLEAMVAVDYATAEKLVEATFSMIEARRNQRVRVEAAFMNEAGRAMVEREARFKIELPTREVAMLVAYTQAAGQFTHKAQMQWDRAADAKLDYDVALSQTVRRGENIVDGHINVRSAILNAAVTLANRVAPGRMYATQVDVTTGQTLTINNVLIITHPTYKNTITLKHPMFSRVSRCLSQSLGGPDTEGAGFVSYWIMLSRTLAHTKASTLMHARMHARNILINIYLPWFSIHLQSHDSNR